MANKASALRQDEERSAENELCTTLMNALLTSDELVTPADLDRLLGLYTVCQAPR